VGAWVRGCRAGLSSSRQTDSRGRAGQRREWRETGLRDVRGCVLVSSFLLETLELVELHPQTRTACRTRRCSGAVVGRVDTREYAGEDDLCPSRAPFVLLTRGLQVHLVRLMEDAMSFENIGTPVPPQRSQGQELPYQLRYLIPGLGWRGLSMCGLCVK
jgi:hypothetical protein